MHKTKLLTVDSWAAAVGGLALVLAMVGCGGSGSSTPQGPAGGGGSGGGGAGANGGSGGVDPGGGGDPGPVDFNTPDPAYTGFDGTHTYSVPLATTVSGTVTWTVSDPTIATIVPIPADKVPPDQAADGLQWAMLTAKKAGNAMVTVKGATSQATSNLTVTAHTADEWTAGKTRWTTAPTGVIACTTCHDGAGGVNNTPSAVADYSDAEVVKILTLGQYPDGTPLRAPNHTFTLTDAEKNGLVAYLRALPPKGF